MTINLSGATDWIVRGYQRFTFWKLPTSNASLTVLLFADVEIKRRRVTRKWDCGFYI